MVFSAPLIRDYNIFFQLTQPTAILDEEIENPLTRKVRYLDKLIDELAKGKSIAKILRD